MVGLVLAIGDHASATRPFPIKRGSQSGGGVVWPLRNREPENKISLKFFSFCAQKLEKEVADESTTEVPFR